ncbi:MAG: hypothetical protein ACYCT1_08440 [Steroidobacteraceae bacterium]
MRWSNVVQAVYNPSTSTLLLVASAGDTSTSAVVTLGATTATVALTNGQAAVPLTVHPSAANCSLRGTVTDAQGTTDFNVGDPSGPVIPFQVVAPAAAGDPYTVYPTRKVDVIGHYLTADVFLDLLYRIVAIHVAPGLQASTYTPLSLPAAESAALQALQAALAAIPNLT